MGIPHLGYNREEGTRPSVCEDERRHGRGGLCESRVAEEFEVRAPLDIARGRRRLVLDADGNGDGTNYGSRLALRLPNEEEDHMVVGMG